MGLVVAHREKPAMHLGVQRLHAPVHHFGKARQVGDILHRERRRLDRLRGAAGRDKLDARLVEGAGEIGEPGLVGNRNEGAANALNVGGCGAGCGGGHGAGLRSGEEGEGMAGR